jgi:adenosylmethionine-8-amino-7-oxononanoate aminotransferase
VQLVTLAGVTRFWHPFADMGKVDAQGELVLERGEGVTVFDDRGRSYLDATAALWYCMVGYGREEIADAAAQQLRTLASYSCYADLATAPTVELAERIAARAPVDGSVVFFTSGGGDAVETAAKMVRLYWSLADQPERTVVIARERAYHGMNAYGTSLAGAPAFSEGIGTLVPDVVHVPWDSTDALREAIDERTAGFFCEPVIGAGGVLPPPTGYLEEARRICRDAGVLFVADEVITAFGRLGHWFASERFGLEPDLITFAKGSTSGYLPLGGVVAAPLVWEPLWKGAGLWRHGYTYSGHATVAAAALANLDLLEGEGIVERALGLETELTEALAPLTEHPLVSEVRSGTGVLAAVQLADPAHADALVAAAREAGVLTRPLLGGALQVSPALVIGRSELDELTGRLLTALDATQQSLAPAAA